MSLSSAWKRLTARFRTPTLAEAQLDDRKKVTAEIAECDQMIRHNQYIRAIAVAQLAAINEFEGKEKQNGPAARIP